MPGLTARTVRHSGEVRFTKDGTSGLGPTRLISPFKTFHSCGASSNLYRLRKAPTRVIRVSPETVIRAPDLAWRIDRNFTSRNGRPSFPTRTCPKNIGAPSSSHTAIAHTTSTGAQTRSPAKATERSTTALRTRAFLEAIAQAIPGELHILVIHSNLSVLTSPPVRRRVLGIFD